jgi:hypothetical protein
MRLATIAKFLVAVGGAAASACGGSTHALSDGGSGVSAQQACEDGASAYCTELATCSQIAIPSDYGDRTTCTARRTQSCVNALAAPGTGMTPATIETCVAAYSTWSCADFINGVPPAACRPQPGTGASGASCAFDAQCQSAFCSIPRGGECGQCANAPALGTSCADLAHCPSGLFCTKNSQVCTTHATSGGACDDDTTCGYGFRCVGADATKDIEGICTAAVSVDGGACDRTGATGSECDSALNLYCTKGDTCAPYESASSGQPCKFVSDAGTYTYCTGGATCDVSPASAQTGTCTGPAGDGQPCNTAADNACLAPAECIGAVVDGGVTGTCLLASAASCVSGDP